MGKLPSCPECGSKYTYEDGNVLTAFMNGQRLILRLKIQKKQSLEIQTATL